MSGSGVDRPHRIAVVPGDGIGPEVTEQAIRVLDAVEKCAPFTTERTTFDLGGEHYLRTGETLNEGTLAELSAFDAIVLGAIGHPSVSPSILERELLLRLRARFDLFANLRPIKLRPGVKSALEGLTPDACDMLIVRENTESLYVGAGGVAHYGSAREVASQESLNTRFAVERILRYAFELATRRRGKLTLVHKTNVLSYAGDLWVRTLDEVAHEFPHVERNYLHVDAACLFMVIDPGRFDVVVTDNLFGDILSDLGAGIQGGIGLAASANLDPVRRSPSMFEPIHGSAPDIAGSGLADPTAAVISVAMMLEFLGETSEAALIEEAVNGHLRSRAGSARQGWDTASIGDDIVARVQP